MGALIRYWISLIHSLVNVMWVCPTWSWCCTSSNPDSENMLLWPLVDAPFPCLPGNLYANLGVQSSRCDWCPAGPLLVWRTETSDGPLTHMHRSSQSERIETLCQGVTCSCDWWRSKQLSDAWSTWALWTSHESFDWFGMSFESSVFHGRLSYLVVLISKMFKQLVGLVVVKCVFEELESIVFLENQCR